jgi:O-antigen/teichoic acid export membrane protein
MALPGALVLLLVGPALFRVVFGPAWEPAGRYAQLLSPYMFFAFVASPLAFLPFVLDRQWQSFLLSTTGNALFLACIAAGGALRRPEAGFAALSVVQALFFTVYIAWMLRIAGQRTMSEAKSQ